MLLGFNPQFVPKILDGTKIHTFRKGDRWKAGNSIQMCTGMRSKEYKQFNANIPELQICKCVQECTIQIYANEPDVLYKIGLSIANRMILPEHVFLFAYNDGFESLTEFCDWFLEHGTEIYPGIFESKGQIIHWTDNKY